MTFKYLLLFLLFTAATQADEQQLLTSPCPEVFRFDSQESGAWNATLLVRSPHILKGIFIKLYFDQDVDELSVQGDFEGEVLNLDDPANRAFLIKNKDAVLDAGRVGKDVKISVSYSGSPPNIKEFRVNGYTFCPNINADRVDFYPNDPQAAALDYLKSIRSETSLFSTKDCGKFEGKDGFPWQAALFTTDGKKYNYTCEAVLISPKYLATSAHCVSYLNTRMPLLADKLAAYFGIKNLEQRTQQPFSISRVILYPGYQPQNLFNDIALLQIKNPAEIKAMPVCLPSDIRDEGIKETLAGFKLENKKFGAMSSAELKKNLPDDCFKTEALNAFVEDNNYCASYTDEKFSSIGDSGSGSYARVKDQYELRGLLSLGGALLKDNSRNILLTDVYKYQKWIRRILAV